MAAVLLVESGASNLPRQQVRRDPNIFLHLLSQNAIPLTVTPRRLLCPRITLIDVHSHIRAKHSGPTTWHSLGHLPSRCASPDQTQELPAAQPPSPQKRDSVRTHRASDTMAKTSALSACAAFSAIRCHEGETDPDLIGVMLLQRNPGPITGIYRKIEIFQPTSLHPAVAPGQASSRPHRPAKSCAQYRKLSKITVILKIFGPTVA